MELKFPRKPLWTGGALISKRVAFLAVAGLALVVGIFLRASHYLGEPAGEEKAPVTVEAPKPAPAAPPTVEAAESVPKTPPATQQAATTPSEPAEQAGDLAEQTEPEGDAVEQANQSLPDAGTILVARKPIELLASPSADATVMFGFPAGRPFRVIGQEGGFAHIRDMRSGATGWIDQAALAPPPPRAPAVSAPPQAKRAAGGRKSSTASTDPKPKATKKKETSVADDSATAVQPQKRPGLFGQGGLFGGLFSGGN